MHFHIDLRYVQIHIYSDACIKKNVIKKFNLVLFIFGNGLFLALSDGVVSKTLNPLGNFFNIYSTTILLKQKK